MGGVRLIADDLQVRAPLSAVEWEDYYALRWRVLRAPWNQPRGSERDAFDATGVHRMVCDRHANVVAVGRLQCNEDGSGQIRYMAVDEAWRRRGLGTLLLQALEHEARGRGMTKLQLEARENAVDFYARRGYRLIGPSHLLFDEIQHYRMEKQWQNCSA